MTQYNSVDLIVIGGGTTGLFATYYATMRGMSVKLIESQSQLGGKVMQFFPEKRIYDVGGYPAITGEELVAQMRKQAERHQPEIRMNEWVESIQKVDDTFEIETDTGDKHYAKTVLLATGNGTFYGKKPDGWKEDNATKEIAKFTIMDAAQYVGKTVVISSDMKTGVEWGLFLEDKAKEVIMVNPDSRFNYTNKADIEKIENSSVKINYETKIVDLHVEEDQLSAVTIEREDGEQLQIEADELLMYHGVELKSAPFNQWGVDITKGRILVEGDMATNVPGIFAAGDIVSYEGKTGLIAIGYSEAITAVNKAHKFINPKAVEQQYSTVIYR